MNDMNVIIQLCVSGHVYIYQQGMSGTVYMWINDHPKAVNDSDKPRGSNKNKLLLTVTGIVYW